MTEAIQIKGLKEFSNNLKVIDSNLPKALRLALNEAASIVVDAAKPDIPSKTGRARKSVKPRSTRKSVRVVGGGNRAPYYPWLDFGGKVGRNKSVSRRFYSDGRYLYFHYFKKRDSGEFQELLERVLLDVAESAGIVVD
jgi:hypothetical protein